MLLARALGHALEEPRLHLAPPPLPRLEGAAVLLRRVASHRAPCPSPGAHAVAPCKYSRQRLRTSRSRLPEPGASPPLILRGFAGPRNSWIRCKITPTANVTGNDA